MCALQYVLFLKIRSLIMTICALESSCEGRKGGSHFIVDSDLDKLIPQPIGT